LRTARSKYKGEDGDDDDVTAEKDVRSGDDGDDGDGEEPSRKINTTPYTTTVRRIARAR